MTDGRDRFVRPPDDDDALLHELRVLVGRLDPVPPRVLDGARAAYTWRTIDAELIELTRDSATEASAESALVRAVTGPRLLVFESERISIELEVSAEPDQRLRLVGQLVPPARATIEIQQRGGTTTTESDELGRFMIGGLSPGPSRLRCHLLDGGRSMTTEWTQL
jgi:hypothetical protein